MQNKTLILDLDNTIFETRSMDRMVFKEFFQAFISRLQKRFNQETIQKIEEDLWKQPWNKIAEKYQIPAEDFVQPCQHLQGLEAKLKITPYYDYRFLKDLPCRKFLVTTSIVSLQESKIRALKIENDFIEILINDPFEGPGKKALFEQLIRSYNLDLNQTFVIGDDPQSEIAAGNALGLQTVQVLRKGILKGTNAMYYIKSFSELEKLLTKN